jgi:hypothetical protein
MILGFMQPYLSSTRCRAYNSLNLAGRHFDLSYLGSFFPFPPNQVQLSANALKIIPVCLSVSQWMNLVFDPLAKFLAGAPKIVFLLQTEPEIRTISEVTGKAECGVRRDGAASRNNGSNSAMRDTRIDGETILG